MLFGSWGSRKPGDDAAYATIGQMARWTGCWTNLVCRPDPLVNQTWLKGGEAPHDIAAPFSLRLDGLSG